MYITTKKLQNISINTPIHTQILKTHNPTAKYDITQINNFLKHKLRTRSLRARLKYKNI